VYATGALSINRRKGVTERKADAFSVTASGAEAYCQTARHLCTANFQTEGFIEIIVGASIIHA
jgi:hypothetical protein